MKQNSEPTIEERQLLALGEAGISYSVASVLPLLFSLVLMLILPYAAGSGYSDTDWYKYLAYLLPQVCFAAAAILFFRRSKVSPHKMYCGCKWYYFFIALFLQFGLLFALGKLNGYFIDLLKLLGYKETGDTLPALSGWNLLPALLIIALLPAIFEETIFRGILSGSMQRRGWGTVATLFISGALFSLFHHNPEQTIYQFLCGVCLTLVSIRAGSILPTILAHFANNAAILVLTSAGFGDLQAALSWGGYLAVVIVSAVCLIGSLVFLIFFDRKSNQKGGVVNGKRFFLTAAIGIAVCAAQWIAYLIERML